MLKRLKAQQEQSKRLCGKSYSRVDEGYVCLNELGERICPAYLSRSFSRILAQNGLRHIRFHDLRHPYVKPTTKKYLFFLVPMIQLS